MDSNDTWFIFGFTAMSAIRSLGDIMMCIYAYRERTMASNCNNNKINSRKVSASGDVGNWSHNPFSGMRK